MRTLTGLYINLLSSYCVQVI